MAAVGATVAAVGAVTGNKALTMVGGAIGAIGAIGGLAAGAGLFGSAASSDTLFGPGTAASTASSASDSAATPASAFGSVTSDAAGGAGAAGAADYGSTVGAFGDTSAADAASAGTIDSIANQLPQPAESALGQNPGTDVTTLSSATDNATATDPAADLTTPTPKALVSGDTTTNSILNGGTGTSTDTAPPGTAATQAQQLIGTPPAPPGGDGTTDPVTGQNVVTGDNVGAPSSGAFSSILKFANDNKVVTAGAIQAGGSLLSGLTSTLTPAQVDALNAQAAANNAAAALTKQQTANLAAPKSVASSAPVTGTPGTLVPSQQPAPGLINSAAKLAPVTGAAA